MAKAKVLVVEDSEFQANELRKFLEHSGYEVICAGNGVSAIHITKTQHPDIILLDVVLPDVDGHEICRWLKEMNDETRRIPIIMLTVKDSIEDKISGLQIGADDYLSKPFNDMELNARIYALLRTKALQDELIQKNVQLEELLKKVEHMAITDYLTGLYNRRHFQSAVEKEFLIAQRYKTPLSCMLIDIDHFKKVNDIFGHEVGDSVLVDVAEIITKDIREVDIAARYGGDEFIVLFPRTEMSDSFLRSAEPSGDAALKPALRILRDIAVHNFKGFKGPGGITVSIGISGAPDPLINTEEKLLRCTDRALYKAKRNGRNRIEVADGSELLM